MTTANTSEAERVLRRLAAGGGVKVAGAVVVEAGLGIELPRGEQERQGADDASRRVELRDDVAKGVVGDLVEDSSDLVQHQPHRVQMFG